MTAREERPNTSWFMKSGLKPETTRGIQAEIGLVAVIERRSSEHVSRALRILAVSRAGTSADCLL